MKLFAICLLAVLATAVSAHGALVGYWNFSETSATVAHNSVVGGPNGTLLGGAHFVSNAGSILGGDSVRLDHATGDLIDFGNNYNFTGSFSVVVWVRLAAGDTTPMVPLSKYESTGAANGYFVGLGKVSGGQSSPYDVYPQFVESGSSSQQIADQVNNGNWHMLAGIFDPSNPSNKLLTIFDPRSSGSTLNGAMPMVSNSADFLLGGVTTSSIALNEFTGWIDEVRIYDSVLNGSDVLSIYNSTIPEPLPINTFAILAFALSVFIRHKRIPSKSPGD